MILWRETAEIVQLTSWAEMFKRKIWCEWISLWRCSKTYKFPQKLQCPLQPQNESVGQSKHIFVCKWKVIRNHLLERRNPVSRDNYMQIQQLYFKMLCHQSVIQVDIYIHSRFNGNPPVLFKIPHQKWTSEAPRVAGPKNLKVY